MLCLATRKRSAPSCEALPAILARKALWVRHLGGERARTDPSPNSDVKLCSSTTGVPRPAKAHADDYGAVLGDKKGAGTII